LIDRTLAHIERYRPVDQAAFLAEPMAQDAIPMRLQEIGENLARIRRIDEDQFAEISSDSWIKLIGTPRHEVVDAGGQRRWPNGASTAERASAA